MTGGVESAAGASVEMNKLWKKALSLAVEQEDDDAVRAAAREKISGVVRYLSGQLYTPDEEAKHRAVHALGVVAAEESILDRERAVDLLRRFAWALNDESGAVPYGIPEAIGEVISVRPEFQEAFLPILCSLLTEDDMSQTGPVERGAFWAVGRVGPPVARYSATVVDAVRAASESHSEPETAAIAGRALAAIMGSTPNEHP